MDRSRRSGQQVETRKVEGLPIEWTSKGESPVYYTNNVGINASSFDVTLQIGLTKEVTAKNMIVQEQARIIMSPQHAIVLLDALRNVLNEYDRLMGEAAATTIPPAGT
jgi:hypothetical protein